MVLKQKMSLRQMAEDHDIIFATSFGYMETMLKVAKDYPNVKFEHATGYKQSDNMASYGLAFVSSPSRAGHYRWYDDEDK